MDCPEKLPTQLEIVFQYTPDSKAPAEMKIFFPELNAWFASELASETIHNLMTRRGEKSETCSVGVNNSTIRSISLIQNKKSAQLISSFNHISCLPRPRLMMTRPMRPITSYPKEIGTNLFIINPCEC